MRTIVFATLAFFASAVVALGGASDWFVTEGARMRLVVNDKAENDGTFRGALEIDLLPGWKTYWRDPGDAGIPPTVDVANSTNISAVEIAFPAPGWFSDSYSTWAGYKQALAFPLTFTAEDPEVAARVVADVFLGVCKDICIPVQTEFSADANPQAGSSHPVVDAAFDALPPAANDTFGLSAARLEGDMLVATAHLPDGRTETDLFLAGSKGWYFGVPELSHTDDGTLTVRVSLLETPKETSGSFHYTLVSDKAAVSGLLILK